MAKGRKPPHGGGGSLIPAPTGLTATPVATGISLSWNAVASATTYWVWRDAYVFTIIPGTTVIDTTVTKDTHQYSVAAVVNSTLGPACTPVTVTVD